MDARCTGCSQYDMNQNRGAGRIYCHYYQTRASNEEGDGKAYTFYQYMNTRNHNCPGFRDAF